MLKNFYRKSLGWNATVMLHYTFKWLLLSLLIGIVVGSGSALFLASLDFVTQTRETYKWLIIFLPLAGLIIGLLYHYCDKNIAEGNNLIIEQVQQPNKNVPMLMAPLIFVTTLMTHLFGGSAGREGTAVQMGASIADQIVHFTKLRPRDRRLILICGISAGFASVFGTPLAATIFAMEVSRIGKIKHEALIPALLSASVGDVCCTQWGILHTKYVIGAVPSMSLEHIIYCIIAGMAFGLVGLLFTKATTFASSTFKKYINYPPLRPFCGGVIVALAIYFLGTTKYIGLGLPTISSAFQQTLPFHDFAIKLLFTCVTLGSGFKGGEVTPLFFIGACLGSALSLIIPLPVFVLAAMGFVAVFASTANTPLATTLMAIELFGINVGLYAAIACAIAYLFSGHTSIYSSQRISTSKHLWLGRDVGKKIGDI